LETVEGFIHTTNRFHRLTACPESIRKGLLGVIYQFFILL
jgi:hypothetical protein